MRTFTSRIIYLLGSIPLLGDWLRRKASGYPEGSVVTIKRGGAAGMKFMRSHRHVNGYWMGIYEPEMQQALSSCLRPGAVLYDIGANAGFFSLLAAKCVGAEGQVFAFEPDPKNAEAARAQFKLNGLQNCHLVELAVGRETGMASFECAGSESKFAEGKAEACITIPVITLDDFLKDHRAPDVVKMDVEGAELDAMLGGMKIFERDRPPVWLIELHGEKQARGVWDILTKQGYEITTIRGDKVISDNVPSHVMARKKRTGG